MKDVIFELDHWIWKSLEDFVAYKDMCGLVNSREAIAAYKEDLHFFALEPDLHPEGSASKMRQIERCY